MSLLGSILKSLTGGGRSGPAPDQQDPVSNIFICGCGHSGTSLLAAMMGAHRDVYAVPNETYLFLQGMPPFPDHSDEDVVRAFAGEFRASADAKGARIVCEKTPLHIHFIPRIRSLFPGSKILIPLRDPRDVALSLKSRTGDLREGYERWMVDNAVVAREKSARAPDVFVFRYEDLIADPGAVLTRICGHVGLPFDDEMLNYHRDERPWFGSSISSKAAEPDPTDHVNFRSWQIRQPLQDRRGRWRTLLSEREVSEIEDHCGRLMVQLGYTPSKP